MKSPLGKMKRRVMRTSGYRKARTIVLRRMRRSKSVRNVASRVLTGPRGGMYATFPTTGRLLAGVGLEGLPTVVISLVDLPDERISDAVEEIARHQLLYASFRPVFVMDKPRMDATRRFGYATELLIERAGWDFPGTTWMEYATARMHDINERYRATAILTVPPEGVTDAIRMVLPGANRG